MSLARPPSVLAAIAAVALGACGAATLTATQSGPSRTLASSEIAEPTVAPVPAATGPVSSGPLAVVPTLPTTPSVRPPAPSAPPPTSAGNGSAGLLAGLADALFDSTSGAFASNFDNSGDSGLVEGAAKPRIVTNPDDPSRSAWKFNLDGGGKRSEVLPKGPGTEPTDGDEQWVRYSAILGDRFPTETDDWQLILQWHHDSPTGSPPLALQVTGGQLKMVSEGTDMASIGPVSPGQRIDLVMRVVFDRDPDRGTVTVWRDGKPTGVTDWHPPDGTMSTEGAYLKMGMYRSPDIEQPGSVTVTDLKIGSTARSVGGTGDLPSTTSP